MVREPTVLLRLEWLPTLGNVELLLDSGGGGPAAAAFNVSKKLIEFWAEWKIVMLIIRKSSINWAQVHELQSKIQNNLMYENRETQSEKCNAFFYESICNSKYFREPWKWMK